MTSFAKKINKQSLLLLTYLVGTLSVIALGVSDGWMDNPFSNVKSKEGLDDRATSSVFVNSRLYLMGPTGDHKLNLKSNRMIHNQKTSDMGFESPVGRAYSRAGSVIDFSGEKGGFDGFNKMLRLVGDVKLVGEGFKTSGHQFDYSTDSQKYETFGNIKSEIESGKTGDQLEITSQGLRGEMDSDLHEYYGNVKGELQKSRVYQRGLKFGGSKVLFLGQENRLTLTDDVYIHRQGMKASAGRGKIYLENYNKKLKYFALYDDVVVRERIELDRRSFERVSYSGQLEGIQSQELIVLSGFPKVVQDGDTIQGNRILLRENNEVIEVDDASGEFNLK